MGWEYTRYKARCESCGKEGVCIRGSDDWNRTSTTWEGFNNESPNAVAVAQGKSDRREMVGHCSCGNSKLVVGDCLT